MDKKDNLAKGLEQRCTELEKQVEYYKNIAEKTGQKRLREVEQLNRLIFERKKSEKALRASEQRFRLIAQSTNDIFYQCDIESGELEWFGDIDSALGYEVGEIKHTLEDWLRLIHPKDRLSFEDAVLLHKESTKPIDYIYRVMCKNGSIKYWNDNGSPIMDQEGKPKKWVGGISDITERKKAEEVLIQAQRLSAIGELASGVAHDFNNSLQGIFGNIELALLRDISPEVRGYLETIKKSAVDAASRIQQLQRFSGKGKSQNGYEQLNLNSIVDDAVSQTRPLWKDESEKVGITIAIEKNYAGKELRVDANAGELRSVLYNLIKNSVHAMSEGGKLAFETREAEMGVYITVTDTGTGMDEEVKARVLQPFFTTKGFEQGKGLGMSTSYAIVKEHGGEIYVKETVLGKGTSIEIMLPYSKRKENRLEDTVSGYEGSARVLWVDDEKVVRDTGKDLLETLKHSADVAASGEEALSLLRNNQYDLMITDVGMPNMSGWQLTERIRGNYPEMKVAVVTGWGADVSNEEKGKYGVGYVLGKPIDMGQLKHIVGEVLQLKQK
ncbi:MAG: response regulator [Desulfobacteraceae bacterium]|nr:response regulator [Desulfobacteraceae bacterium]